MNIFYLDYDPVLAAAYHNDKHCVKMILETCQLLSTALHQNGCDDSRLYKQTHLNHPCAVWVRDNQSNYIWTTELLDALLREYTVRYGKIHKCQDKLSMFQGYAGLIKSGRFYRPPKCMPEDCKMADIVESYRKYYMTHKRHIAAWKTQTPHWFK